MLNHFALIKLAVSPEEPTGVFDLSLETTSGSSSELCTIVCTMVCTGDTGSNDGYSNTSVLSLNDMLSCKKQINIKSKIDNTVQYWHFSEILWQSWLKSGVGWLSVWVAKIQSLHYGF